MHKVFFLFFRVETNMRSTIFGTSGIPIFARISLNLHNNFITFSSNQSMRHNFVFHFQYSNENTERDVHIMNDVAQLNEAKSNYEIMLDL